MDTWSATTIKPNYINHNEETKMPDRGNIPNDYIVGSTLDLAPGHINYSTDSLTTYFTMMSYLMGTFECSMCYAWEEFKICFSGIGNSSQCYGALGCLNITEDWFGLARPVNLLPLDREVINTQFILRTRDSYGVRFLSTYNDLRDEEATPIS